MPSRRYETARRSLSRIKILQFVTGFHVGGTERQVAHLVRNLDPSRFEVHIACMQPKGALHAEIASSGLPLTVYDIHAFLRPSTWRQQMRFAAYVRDHGIDIVHAYGFYPIVFAVPVARLARAPVVVASVRDSGDPWTAAQRLVQMSACRLAHRILVNAGAVKSRLVMEGHPRRAISVIRNGVEVDRFAPRPNDSALRASLGVPSDAPMVVAVSRLNPLKGIDDFLEAAKLLSVWHPEARFVIVGYGPSRAKLEERARRLEIADRVVFAGERLDVPAILSQAAVSVAPSLSEALSNVVLESMATGVPVVATRVGGIPEVLTDEVHGLLVPPCDAPALARAIGRFLADPSLARGLGAAARTRVVNRFSMERMLERTENLYTRLLRGDGGAAPDEEADSETLSALVPPAAVMARRRKELRAVSRQWSPP